jgi:alkylation response protein AidB-like acyl-CoA dehydrogenase
MDSPGIDIRPLDTMGGHSEFAELFLEEVRIPVDNRVGEENDGWRVAMVTFSFERGTAFVGDLLEARELLVECVSLAQRTGLWNDAGVRRQAGHLWAELDALWALVKRNVSTSARGSAPELGGSVFKLGYTDARQKLGEFSLAMLGRAGLSFDTIEGGDGRGRIPGEAIGEDWLRGVALSIFAGTSQIQRNILSERMLGLPK